MRESIGGAWLFGLVITFIVFFASFLALSINFSKAFNVKNEVVDLIEKYEGNNCNARNAIAGHLRTIGYLVYGNCPEDEIINEESGNPVTIKYQGYNADGDPVKGKALYCIAENTASTDTINKKYYKAVVFFKVDLPMMENIATFKIKGETSTVFWPTDEADATC